MAIVLSYSDVAAALRRQPEHHRARRSSNRTRGDPVRIVGVAPPGFTYPAGTEAWLVWKSDRDYRAQVDIVARIANDATPKECARGAECVDSAHQPIRGGSSM